jgi:hypothetical protein
MEAALAENEAEYQDHRVRTQARYSVLDCGIEQRHLSR